MLPVSSSSMTSLPTAKMLLFIALALNPGAPPHDIFITSPSENYKLYSGDRGWTIESKGSPGEAWNTCAERVQDPNPGDADMRSVVRNSWLTDSFVQLPNGNRVEKQGDAGFYIVNPGCPNQTVYTILYPKD
jgi:hypothetical protein